MSSNKNQLSNLAPNSFNAKKLSTQHKVSDNLPEIFKLKTVCQNFQTEIRPSPLPEIDNNTISKNNATTKDILYEKNVITKRIFEKEARSASPQKESTDCKSKIDKKKTQNKNEFNKILLFKKFKDLEEICKNATNWDIHIIHLCLEIIHCLDEYE